MTREEIEEYVWTFLKSKNLADEVASSIMGNIEAESEFNPDLVEVGNNIGFGLCQWSYERRNQLESYGTSLSHQLDFLWSELTGENLDVTGASIQWIDLKGYTYSDFIWNKYSLEESTSAFCWCFERPNAIYAHLDRRKKSATYYYNKFQGIESDIDTSNNLVNKAVKWLIDIANDDSHGYDQDYRWGERGDYDCSSFVITGFEQAGIPLKSKGATFTGNMRSVCKELGFTEISLNDWTDCKDLLPGDILLNEENHVAVYIGNGQIVHASINENGGVTGGSPGDQTGKEIYIRDYYIYPSGWDIVLRYKYGGTSPGNTPVTTGEVWEDICNTSYNINQLTSDEITELKKLSYNDKCRMKYTYNREKKFIGWSAFNTKLIFDNKEYRIKEVVRNGYLKIYFVQERFYKIVNPKFIIRSEKE